MRVLKNIFALIKNNYPFRLVNPGMVTLIGIVFANFSYCRPKLFSTAQTTTYYFAEDVLRFRTCFAGKLLCFCSNTLSKFYSQYSQRVFSIDRTAPGSFFWFSHVMVVGPREWKRFFSTEPAGNLLQSRHLYRQAYRYKCYGNQYADPDAVYYRLCAACGQFFR